MEQYLKGNNIRRPNAVQVAHKMKEVFDEIGNKRIIAQAIQAEQANKHCCKGRVLKTGNHIRMDVRKIMTQKPSKTLDRKRLGS
jgi:nucleoid DNA-binding protein